MIKKNIESPGRWLRCGIGVLLLVYAYWKMSWLALAGAAFTFFESYMSWCVVYQILGKSSCPLKKK